jgi:hypothetical protein
MRDSPARLYDPGVGTQKTKEEPYPSCSLMPDAANRCVPGRGTGPGYEQHWTAIRNEPDKPIWITRQRADAG